MSKNIYLIAIIVILSLVVGRQVFGESKSEEHNEQALKRVLQDHRENSYDIQERIKHRKEF